MFTAHMQLVVYTALASTTIATLLGSSLSTFGVEVSTTCMYDVYNVSCVSRCLQRVCMMCIM